MRKLLITVGLITGAGSLFAGPLHDAMRQGKNHLIEDLLINGENINEVVDGKTPLNFSLWTSTPDYISEMLINYGANVNIKDSNHVGGRSALHWAAVGGKYELVKLIIDKKAAIETRDYEENTPLHYASQGKSKGYKDIVELLILKKADINSKGYLGMTPLHLAIDSDNLPTADWLIYKEAKVNAQDNEGNTPLHKARSKEAAELLVSKSANVKARNDLGQTVLWSRNWDSPKKLNHIEFLITAGANANGKDIYGKSIVDYLEYQVAGSKKLIAANKLRNEYGALTLADELRKDLEDLRQKVEQGSTGNTNPTDEWPRKMWEIDLEEVDSFNKKKGDVRRIDVRNGEKKSMLLDIAYVLENGANSYDRAWVSDIGEYFVLENDFSTGGLMHIGNNSLIYKQNNEVIGKFRHNNKIVEKRHTMPNLSPPKWEDPHTCKVQVSWEGSTITGWDFTPPTLASTDNEGGNSGGNTAMSRLSIGNSGPDISIATDGKLGGPAELQKSNDLKNWRKLGDVPADSAELLITPRDSGNEFFRLKRVGE